MKAPSKLLKAQQGKIAIQPFLLNGNLSLSYAHFEERKGIILSSDQVKIAIQPKKLNGKLHLSKRASTSAR